MDWQRSWFCMCITKNRKKCTYREYSAMERCTLFLVIKCFWFFTCFYCVVCRTSESPPVVNSVTVLRKTVQNLSFDTGVNYLVKVEGENLNPQIFIRVTAATGARGSQCVFQSDNINHDLGVFLYPRFINETLAFFTVIVVNSNLDEPLYLCVGFANAALNLSISEYRGELIKWIHQGQNVFLVNDNHQNRSSDRSFSYISSNISSNRIRTPREAFLLENENEQSSNVDVQMDTTMQSLDKRKRAVEDVPVVIHGLRVETAENSASFGEDGVIELLAHTTCKFRLFGQGLSSNLQLAFTTTESDDGFCEFPSSEIFKVLEGSVTNHSAVVEIHVPPRPSNNAAYFLCIKDGSVSNTTKDTLQKKLWFHQGSEKWLQFRVYEKLLPVWITIIIIISLLFFSALFSGLTLGLMSMDKTDLKILCTTGTELERQYASAILPVRSHGSLLLCSLLLGNVLVNSVLTILMDDLTSGLIAVVFSTLAIVIFGEIMPQAICSRHGLAVGAKTIYITKFVILVTCVVAFPISKILDCMLGEEIGNVYNRERLKELVKTGTDIEKDEVNIISGALELRKKTVSDVMTKLEDVYMLDYHAILDFETVSEIMKSGFSRIPVYEGRRSNIVAMLFIKDLAFIDPDDNTPLKQVCDFYQNQCYFVFEDQTLDVLFKHFKDGNKGHMAFVTRVNSEGEGDPFYEAIGLVTLEDVIEELIQAEIVDETDVFTDNRSKRKRERKHMKQDFTTFCERRENQRIHISPQLTLATFQYLSTIFQNVGHKAVLGCAASYSLATVNCTNFTTAISVVKHIVLTAIGLRMDLAAASFEPVCVIFLWSNSSGKITARLVSAVDAFKPDVISETILRRLIKQDVIYQIKVKNKEKGKADPSTIIYKQGKPVDYFALILEGRVEVIVGREELKFESGPFTYFGTQALRQNISVGGDSPTTAVPTTNAGSLQSVNLENTSRLTFVPDYTVRAITEVFYIKIKRSLYMAAKKATLMGNSQKSDDHFDDEVDKLLHSLDEDDKSQDQSQESPLLNRNPSQNEKESQQRSDSTALESPGSQHAPINTINPSSPLEPNGRLRSPLSPVKSRLEDNSILKIFSDKLSEGNEKFISAENLSGEERTNLLCQTGEIS